MEKNCQVPRMSSGLDIHHFILGSEGMNIVTTISKFCLVFKKIFVPNNHSFTFVKDWKFFFRIRENEIIHLVIH